MTIKVTYTGVKGAAEESRPITFRERALQGQFSSPSEGYKLYRLRDGRRQQVDDDDDQGYKLVGDEPIDCKVGSSDYFRSLGVGESWTQQLFLSEPRGNMLKIQQGRRGSLRIHVQGRKSRGKQISVPCSTPEFLAQITVNSLR